MESSLLPYLNARNPGLAIGFGGKGPSPTPGAEPAVESGACTVTRWARARVDGLVPFADFIILFQSDHYGTGRAGMTALTNTEIEHQWQATLGRWARTTDHEGMGAPFLRVDDAGMFQPWRPLFHCRQTDAFCHPLCPSCGKGLTLCRDDHLLQDAGLQTYSSSLQRFLHCPQCAASEQSRVFYTCSPMAHPPEHVRDSLQLVKDFGRLLDFDLPADPLPCKVCRCAEECFGPQARVVDRMHPFQFYPFHMLVQPAPDIHSADFVALLSGADPDALADQLGHQPNRERWARFSSLRARLLTDSGFFFPPEPIRFGEVLYLKLSLLQELIALWTSGRIAPAADGLLEDIWVTLGGPGAGLPWLWNFNLQTVDPFGRPGRQVKRPEVLPARLQQRLGEAWFYVLLVNPRQNMAVIKSALENLLLASGKGAMFDPATAGEVFSAQNICWPDRSVEMGSGWDALWQEAIGLGLELMRGVAAQESPASGDTPFASRLSDLRSRVRDLLFQPVFQPVFQPELQPSFQSGHREFDTPDPRGRQADDLRIGEIIDEIMLQWTAQVKHCSEPESRYSADQTVAFHPDALPNEDGDYEETVILDADRRKAKKRRPEPAEPPKMVDPDKTQDQPAAAAHRASEPPSENHEETIAAPPYPSPTEEIDLESTVMLKAGKDLRAHIHPGKTIGIRSTVGIMPEEELEKTQVTPPKGNAPGKGRSSTREKDRLEKTLVIPPKGTAPEKGPSLRTNDTAPPSPRRGDCIEKTLAAPVKGVEPDHGPSPQGTLEAQPSDKERNIFLKALLNSPGKPVPPSVPSPPKSGASPPSAHRKDAREKILVIPPDGPGSALFQPSRGAGTTPPQVQGEDDLENTLVLPPSRRPKDLEKALVITHSGHQGNKQQKPTPEISGPGVDPDLPETVILPDRHHKNGKP